MGCRKGIGSFETGTTRRDVFSSSSGSGTPDEASCACNHGSLETSRRSCCHGVKSLMHGHEGCREDFSYNDDELYAWLHAIECKNTR